MIASRPRRAPEGRTLDRGISLTDPILVAGAGGFIGGWLVRHLRDSGFTAVRAIDIKPLDEWYQRFDRRREPRRGPPLAESVPASS